MRFNQESDRFVFCSTRLVTVEVTQILAVRACDVTDLSRDVIPGDDPADCGNRRTVFTQREEDGS